MRQIGRTVLIEMTTTKQILVAVHQEDAAAITWAKQHVEKYQDRVLWRNVQRTVRGVVKK